MINELENNLYLYWVGKKYKLLKRLDNLIKLHSDNGKNYTIIYLNDKNIKEYIDVPDIFYKLNPVHQSDIVRVFIIEKYGGIWIDTDTIVMENLQNLFNIIKNKNGFLMQHPDKGYSNGIIGSKKQTKLLIDWKKYILDNVNLHMSWAKLGAEYMNSIKDKEVFNDYTIFNTRETMYPLDYRLYVNEFFSKSNNYKTIERKFQPLLVLVNSLYKYYETHEKYYSTLEYFLKKSKMNYESISK